KVPAGTQSFNVRLEDAIYEPVPEEMLRRFPALREVGPEPVIQAYVGTHRKETTPTVVIEPYKRGGAGGVERLVSGRLAIHDVVRGGQGRPKSYPTTSKLAS